MTFVVIVSREGLTRAYGPYRSFKKADGDARAWDGYVVPLEKRDAEAPWDVRLTLSH